MNAFATNRRLAIAPDTVLLCALIVVAPQLYGGAFPWSVATIAALAVLSLGAALWTRRSAPPPAMDGVFVVMSVAWVWTCVQSIALPSGIARALQLASVESAERLEGLTWVNPIAYTISYEPGATHLQILTGVAILSAFLAARLGAASRLRPVAIATVASAVLIGLVGVAHEVAGSDVLFGIYRPRFTTARLLAPLMNSNHLAGFSLVGTLVAAGLAVDEPLRQKRIPWISAAMFCAAVLIWTLSRGAIGALLAGLVVLSAWVFRHKRSHLGRTVVPGAAVGAIVLGTAAFAGLEPILKRFETHGLDKVAVALRGFRLLEGPTWVLGIGRGAFSSAFVRHEGLSDRYTHPENLLVQWTTEWGVPVALALLLVLTWALWRRLRSAEEPLVAAVCVALFALALQNLVDFSLEMAGVVVVAASLLGAVLPARSSSHPSRSRRVLFVYLSILVLVVSGLGPRVPESDTQSIIDRLAQYAKADDEPRFESTLRRGLALHPGEPALPLLAGAYAGSKRHPDAVRWLSVVMEEAPEWAAPHAIGARWLSEEGQIDQALLEVRHAEERRAGSASMVLCDILVDSPRMDYVERAAPADDGRVALLNRTVESCGRLPTDLKQQIDGAILEAKPGHASAALREAQRLVVGEQRDDAVALIEQALESNPDDARLWNALVQAHLNAGKTERASAALARASARAVDSRALEEAKARIEASRGDTDAMRDTLTRLRGRSMGNPAMVASSFMLQGQLEASLGNIDDALAAYEAADVASPTSPALQHAATLAVRSRRLAYARRIYRILCSRQPGGAACAQEAQLSEKAREVPARPSVP